MRGHNFFLDNYSMPVTTMSGHQDSPPRKNMNSQFYKSKSLRRTPLNRLFAVVYAAALLVLLYHHIISILYFKSPLSLGVSLLMLLADTILAFMWCTTQSLRLYPIHRTEFIDEMKKTVQESDFPALDVFICTADPHKEPPVTLLNTTLSVMAYDYPPEKISVYVSDDGGSQFTLFALTEAAKFAKEWLPYCKRNNLVDRSPEAYFRSDVVVKSPETESIKVLYESVKVKVENVLQKGRVEADDITGGKQERDAFNNWTHDCTSRDHPTIIYKVLDKDNDITGHVLPNLVYVSREKRSNATHHFKAGALNVLLRVSALMTNAPIVLTQDCDMYSNDPITVQRALCYFMSQDIKQKLAYIQFPQRYHGINKNDIYANEHKHLYTLNPMGMDGLLGPAYLGTGCFFSRRVFSESPFSSGTSSPDISHFDPSSVTCQPFEAQSFLDLFHQVASCNYEKGSPWGSKLGFRYGSVVEDYFTGYMFKCEGWRSIYCNPPRPAFMGDFPLTLIDMLNQNKRWAIGPLEVAFSKYSLLSFGVRHIGLLMSLGYSYCGFWAFWSIPGAIYSILPQIALLNNISIFPKVTEPLFLLYCFLIIGANGQVLIEFILEGSTVQQWWSDHRSWVIKGTSCYLFALFEFAMKCLGISLHGFGLTSKVIDEEQSKRYDQGLFEFGVHSPMFVPMTVSALLNLASVGYGVIRMFSGSSVELTALVMQLAIAGYFVVNFWPVYDGILSRADKGKMPIKTTLISLIVCSGLYKVFSILIN